MKQIACYFIAATLLAGCAGTRGNIDNGSSKESVCTSQNSMDVELHNITRNHSRYQGRCIRTVGIVTSRLIVEDAAQLSDSTRSKTNANTFPIGVYWNDKSAYKKFHEHPELVTIVGRLDSCERLTRKAQADADEWNKKSASERQDQKGIETIEIPILSGPCHYLSGPVIFIFAYQVLKNPVAQK